MRCIALIIVFAALLDDACLPQTGSATRPIRGEVVTETNNCEASVFPNARIVLRDPADREAQSDPRGAFSIDGLPPGVYGVEASAPGLSASVVVEVKAGAASQVAKRRPTLNALIAGASVFERFGCFTADWSWMCQRYQ